MLPIDSATYRIVNGRTKMLLYRNMETELIDADPDPYCYLPAKYEVNTRGLMTRTDMKTFDTLENVKKYSFPTPDGVKGFRMAVESTGKTTYEADKKYTERWMLANQMTCSDYPNWAAWDTEEFDGDGLPDVEKADKPIIAIGFWYHGQLTTFTGPEPKLLKDAVDFLTENKITLLKGWNSGTHTIKGWDLPYFSKRLAVNRIPFDTRSIRFVDSSILYRYLEKNYKQSWSLEKVGKRILHADKPFVDRRISSLTDAQLRERVGWDAQMTGEIDVTKRYTSLAIELAKKAALFPDSILGMNPKNKNITVTPTLDNWILRQANKVGYVMPNKTKYDKAKYQGAWVYLFKKGTYYNVLQFDFDSLYPNTMLAFKIAPYDRYDVWFPIINSFLEEKKKSGDRLSKLMAEKARDEELDAEIEREKLVRWGQKILVNALYGLMASSYYRFKCADKALATTTSARGVTKAVADFLTSLGYIVYKSDSVVKGSPLAILRDNRLKIVPIEQVKVGDCVLTEKGWTEVRRTIEHKVTKRMYRVETFDGVASVTSDHSLIDSSMREVTPTQIKRGQLLGSIDYNPIKMLNGTKVDSGKAWLLGYFVADGHASVMLGKPSKWKYSACSNRGEKRYIGTKYSAHLDGQNARLLKRAQLELKRLGFESKLYAFKSNMSSGGMIYRLSILNPKKSGAVKYFLDTCYDENHKKKIPEDILNADNEAVEHFIEGYLDGDGGSHVNKDGTKVWTATDIEQVIFGLHILAKKIGRRSRFSVYSRREYLRNIRFPSSSDGGKRGFKPNDEIKRIVDLGIQTSTVYDLETENHHFSVGGILLHNTDSIFVQANTIEDRITIQQLINNFVHNTFHVDNINMAFEAYWENLSFPRAAAREENKKKYYGKIKLDKDLNEVNEFHVVGMEFLRNDWSDIAKEVQDRVMRMKSMEYASKEQIEAYVNEVVSNLLKGRYDDKLVLEVGLKKPLDEYGKPKLNPKTGKMRKMPIPRHVRALRDALQTGWVPSDMIQYEHVRYIMTKGGKPKLLNLVTPDEIDRPWYLQFQVYPILQRLDVIDVIPKVQPQDQQTLD